ncbi:MAG: serine hydrolase domain-containing protein, partial [Minisyncoccia bacterium]
MDTKFNLGSMNKMFTAVAIAQLVEQGRLSFEDPLAKYMPNFPDKKSSQKIRISHLLSHTSGLGNYFNDKYNATPKDQLKTVDDFLGLVKEEKLAFEPGTKYQYSNTGFMVLGKIIELVTQKSYFDYIDEHVYRTASMPHPGSFDLTKVNHNLAVGYDKEYADGGYSFNNNLFRHVVKGGPAGGGCSTAGDLLNFSRALQAGKLISLAMLEKTMTREGLNQHYGFGFEVRADPILGKSFGHSGGFIGISSELTIFPQSGYTAAILSNYSMGSMVASIKLQNIIQR